MFLNKPYYSMKVINITYQVDFSCFYVNFQKQLRGFSSGNTRGPQKNACLIPHCACCTFILAFTFVNNDLETFIIFGRQC